MARKNYGLILKRDYVYKEDDSDLMHAIAAYEAKAYKDGKEQCQDFDTKVLPRVYKRSGEDKIYNDRLFAQLNSGEYKRAYVIDNSKVEKDYFRENAYPKEDRYRTKSIPERFADEKHIRDNRIQTPEKFGDVDGYLHWFVSRAPKIDVVHIDMNETPVKAYSVTDEYFTPVVHYKKVSSKTDWWSQALGYDRQTTIAWLWMCGSKHMTEEEMYALANGMEAEDLGTTPDAQIVKCPDCGMPMHAAPASVGYLDNAGYYHVDKEAPKQMTCKNCGADLSPCFNIK